MRKLTFLSAALICVPALASAQASPATAAPPPPPPSDSPEAGDDYPMPTEPPPSSASTSVSADAALEADAELPEDESADPDAPGPLVIGAELGAIFPQPFSELGTHVSFGLELGYALPVLEEKLEVMLAAAYAPPANDFEVADYDGTIDVQELTFSLGPRYRFLPRVDDWNISAALGVRLFLVQSTSNGSRGDEAFAEVEEQSTEVGFFLALGGEYRLGPGALFLDVDLGYSGLGQDIPGDGKPSSGPDSASTGNLAATLGYR